MPRQPKIKLMRRPQGGLFYRTYNKEVKGRFYAGEIFKLDGKLTMMPAKGRRKTVKIKRK